MKTLPKTSKLAIGAAVLAVLFATGCERRAQEPAAPPAADATTGVTPPQAPSEPATTPVPGATEAPAVNADGKIAAPSEEGRDAGTVVDDAMLTTKVKTALLADSDVKGLAINVDTSQGVVSLNGEVKNQAQVDRAAKLAGEVEGVKSVLNNLTIAK